ncbi:10581_t:CDS:2 [Acaulospora colombiana]|uniref:10581_t:CDS:1 n=1 Tax=Acaulospora colombiana TaxID=27376 RepID=A0ACA9MDJ0_9GLOM|nr:10581_t:CDS:2 [Acaulospora colombiana]
MANDVPHQDRPQPAVHRKCYNWCLKTRAFMPPKRRLENETLPQPKRVRSDDGGALEMYNKIATFENADRVRQDPPVPRLQEAIRRAKKEQPAVGSSVVYWMRMEDMRIDDNRAFAAASAFAKKNAIPVIVLFLFSPGDYAAHDRGARRIDFTLRNLDWLKDKLDKLNIPLYAESHTPRKSLPQKVVELVRSWGCKSLYANLGANENAEYELDEVRRDLKVLEIAKDWGIYCDFYEDKLIVPPYKVSTMQGKQFSAHVDGNPECLAEAPVIQANPSDIRNDANIGPLFEITIPNSIPGFELEDASKMEELWPAGTEAAREILHRFLTTKYRKGQLDVSPLNRGAATVDKKDTRLAQYGDNRAKVDGDTSSRISPYLSAGIISARELVRESMEFLGVKKVNVERENGAGYDTGGIVAFFIGKGLVLLRTINIQNKRKEKRFISWGTKTAQKKYKKLEHTLRSCIHNSIAKDQPTPPANQVSRAEFFFNVWLRGEGLGNGHPSCGWVQTYDFPLPALEADLWGTPG